MDINGKSKIEVIAGGTGLWVGNGGAVSMMQGKIMGGGGSGMYGVQGMGGTVTLNMVNVSGVQKGVEATNGTLEMMGGTVTFEGGKGNYGVMVGRMGTANLTGTRITGEGDGKGVVMGGTTLEMSGGSISNVGLGVLCGGCGDKC